MKIKDYLLLIIIIFCLYLIYINYKKPNVIFDDKLYKKRESELIFKLDSLDRVLKKETLIRNEFKAKIDSLENIKQKIKYIYVIKNKQIDTASISDIIGKFQVIFAKGDIE